MRELEFFTTTQEAQKKPYEMLLHDLLGKAETYLDGELKRSLYEKEKAEHGQIIMVADGTVDIDGCEVLNFKKVPQPNEHDIGYWDGYFNAMKLFYMWLEQYVDDFEKFGQV